MCESAINAAHMLKTLDEQREMFLWKYRDVARNEVLDLFKVRDNYYLPTYLGGLSETVGSIGRILFYILLLLSSPISLDRISRRALLEIIPSLIITSA